MNFRYQTERLVLVAGEPGMAPLVCDYLKRNKESIKLYEREYPEEYYTVDYQEEALKSEQTLMLRGTGVRYYLFLKDNPDFIIGNISFAYLSEDFGHRCSIGYKIDHNHRRQGYAFEAADFLIRELSAELHIKRIEADILPENEPSLALIKKLGFEFEGIARCAHSIAGRERDHLRFSFIPSGED